MTNILSRIAANARKARKNRLIRTLSVWPICNNAKQYVSVRQLTLWPNSRADR
jgi:hypothetical protein